MQISEEQARRLEIVLNFYAETEYGKRGFILDTEWALKMLETFEVFEHDGAILVVGCITHPYFVGKKVAIELMWYVPPEKRSSRLGLKMFQVYEKWAKEVGADVICADCLDDRTSTFYERNGFVLIEKRYMKELT